jgi:hypothetical protein
MQATISLLLKIDLQSDTTGEYVPDDCTAEHATEDAIPSGAMMNFANLNKPSSDISRPHR